MTRSTGAVECYNGVMGRNISSHASFFRFVLGLRYQENVKAKMVKSIVESGGATGPTRKGKSKVSFQIHCCLLLACLLHILKSHCLMINLQNKKVKHAQISAANEALKQGHITPDQFLKRVTHHETKICNNFMQFDGLSAIDDDDDYIYNENDDDDGNDNIVGELNDKNQFSFDRIIEKLIILK